jgi:phage/plasmid-like protein (TIGR03299 family)
MSQETYEWLNKHVLIGYTEQRGRAWHYRSSDQADEPNHYRGPVPVADIHRRLFDWSAQSYPVLVQAGRHGLLRAADRQAVVASDTGDVLGIHSTGYRIHQYADWLIEKVVSLLDGGLDVGSAGLLKNRAQAWVSIEVPENVTTPEGVEFRPHLLACTSHDGSLITTYKRTVTLTVCDNTMGAALVGSGQVIRIKHSKDSDKRFTVLSAREALNLVQATADGFAEQVRNLCRVEVSQKMWQEFLQAHLPDRDSARARHLAETRRAELRHLWDHDERVAPWRGTAWGVVQAVNTHTHHYATVRRVGRPERNASNAVTGTFDKLDKATVATLDTVLATA